MLRYTLRLLPHLFALYTWIGMGIIIMWGWDGSAIPLLSSFGVVPTGDFFQLSPTFLSFLMELVIRQRPTPLCVLFQVANVIHSSTIHAHKHKHMDNA